MGDMRVGCPKKKKNQNMHESPRVRLTESEKFVEQMVMGLISDIAQIENTAINAAIRDNRNSSFLHVADSLRDRAAELHSRNTAENLQKWIYEHLANIYEQCSYSDLITVDDGLQAMVELEGIHDSVKEILVRLKKNKLGERLRQ